MERSLLRPIRSRWYPASIPNVQHPGRSKVKGAKVKLPFLIFHLAVDREKTVAVPRKYRLFFRHSSINCLPRLFHFFFSLSPLSLSLSLSLVSPSDRYRRERSVEWSGGSSQELLDGGGAGSSLSKGNAAIKEALIGRLIPFPLMPGDCDRRAFLVNHFYREIGATISRSDDYLPPRSGGREKSSQSSPNRKPRAFVFLIPTRSRLLNEARLR